MAATIPNVAEAVGIKAFVNHTAPQNLVLRLFTNNKTPDEADVAADYTEAAGGGYAGITLTGSSWSFTGSAGTYAEQTFTFTGPLDGGAGVYGYFLTQASSGILMAAERFTNPGLPHVPFNNGDQIKVTPGLTGA